MRHVLTDAAASDHTSSASRNVRQAVRSLHIGSLLRDWATRPLAAPSALLAALSTASAKTGEADPLVGLLAQLRAAITGYVCQLRADGARPEQTVVRVKALVREAMADDKWYDPAAVQTITAEAVRWSIHAYFDRPPDR